MDPPQKLDGANVLYIDDNVDLRMLVAAVFTRHGATVTACSSAEDGILRLVESRFDIVVCDLNMPPGLDGYDLVHALRRMEGGDQSRVATPTVLVSGNALDPAIQRRFADFQAYIQKPFNPTRLVDVIKRLIEVDSEAVKFGSLASWEANQERGQGPEHGGT